LTTPTEVVAWLGAVQSQDYMGAKWALGLSVAAVCDGLKHASFFTQSVQFIFATCCMIGKHSHFRYDGYKMRYLPRVISFLVVFVCVAFSFRDGRQVLASSTLTLPAGFVDEAAYMGLLAPRAFAFTPDGRVLALERGSDSSNDVNFGSIRVFKNGALLPTRAYTLNICGDGERGLLGIAVDPNFAANGYIYVFYTRQATSGNIACDYNTFTNGNDVGPRNRVSRLTMSGDVVSPGSELVLIDSILSDAGVHNAGDLHFGSDGYLYISTGNSGLSWTAQDVSILNGKILRILPTGSGYSVADNPYDNSQNAHICSTILIIKANGRPPGPCEELYAIGFRNPFRFTMQPSMTGIPGTGSPFVGDVGDGAWEEVDQVRSGGNYGYPACEGPCGSGISGYDSPIYAYSHNNTDSAIIGGGFYTGGANYPAQYLNSYFFADFVRGFIGRLTYNTSTGQWVRAAQDFGTGGSSIVGLKRGPDGNLYYLTFISETSRIDGIHRIRYTTASNNAPPTAQASVNPQSGPLSTTYTFSAASSVDPDNNTPLTYNWDFGDGSPIVNTQNITVTHVYSQSQDVVASLTVTDSGNPPATSAPVTVNVYPGNTPPSGDIVLTNLTDGSRTTTYYAGDTWSYAAANVTDDDMVNPPTVTWEIVFHHQSHTHPFLPTGTPDQQFTIPVTGELDPMVWYRVHMYLTDSRGQQTEVIQDIHPVTKVLTFNTMPTTGQVIIQGVTFPTPLTITRVMGMHFSLSVPSPQIIWGVSHSFHDWSQGGSQQQTIVVPSTDTTYTATFNTIAGAAPPKNYFTTHTPTLTWNRVTFAHHYVVQVGKTKDFIGAPTYQAGNNLAYTLPSLDNGFYYWRVLVCMTVTTCGNWSATDTLIIDAP
jgi:glucose/arabinose dehydrogenase